MYSKHNMFTTCNMINGMNKIAINGSVCRGWLVTGKGQRSSLSLVGAAVFVSSSHLSPHAHCLSKYSLNTIIIPTSSARTCNELHWPHVCFSINTRSVHANYEHCI